jgi:putative inorganic carbon (hco3(-)) transporter
VSLSIRLGNPSTPGDLSLPVRPSKVDWDLAFLGILGYLFVEYTRLAAMFPVLQPLQLGKVAVSLGVLGLIIAPRRRTPGSFAVQRVDAALVCFILASIVSAFFAEYSEPAWEQILDTVQWCLIYFLISRVVSISQRMRFFVFLYLLLNLKIAQFAIRGYFGGLSMGRSSEFMASHGAGAGSTGFFGNQGDFGVAMCVVWPLAGCLLIGEKKKLSKYFLAGCFFVFLGAIIASSSRGAILGAGVVAIVGLLKSPKKIAGVFMILVMGLALLFVVPEASKARLESGFHPATDKTASIRLNLWTAGLKMFEDHPFLGVGPANFPPEYLLYHPTSDQNVQKWVPHSIYIEALSELGLTGLLILAVIWLLLFSLNARTRKALRPLGREGTRTFEYRLSIALDLAFLGFLVSGAFLTVLYYPHLWILLGLSAGLHSSCLQMLSQAKSAESQAPKESPALQRFG